MVFKVIPCAYSFIYKAKYANKTLWKMLIANADVTEDSPVYCVFKHQKPPIF